MMLVSGVGSRRHWKLSHSVMVVAGVVGKAQGSAVARVDGAKAKAWAAMAGAASEGVAAGAAACSNQYRGGGN